MTQNPNIYRIETTNRLLKELSDTESIIKMIIKTSFKKLNYNTNVLTDNINKIEKDNVIYYLYSYNSNETDSNWKDFLPQELTNENDFTQQKLSLILFIETEYNIYCIVGGNAYQIILPFIDQSFGLNTYSKIIKPEYDSLASIKSRSITGMRTGANEQFVDNFRIIDFIKFGKVPQEIHIKLCQQTTDLYFEFLKNKTTERIQIYAGKGFRIKKNVDFETLHNIILEFGHINELAPSDYLSSYSEIKDTDYIENVLRPELINKIFSDIGNIKYTSEVKSYYNFEFDFCNPNNIETFYEADAYGLKEKTENDGYNEFMIVNDKSEIYRNVILRAIEKGYDTNLFNFKVYLQGVRVVCYQNNKVTIGSSFLFHFNTELQILNQPTFLIDTKWYNLRDSFITDLKVTTVHILKTYNAPKSILFKKWNKTCIPTEKEYNLLYNDVNNYIVIDTVIADGIELCDILYYDDTNIYLIHVKYGFSSKIRELSNQVLISAKRLRESLGTKDKIFLEMIYFKLIEKGHNINGLSVEEFKKLFDKKKTFIMAFTSHLQQDLSIEQNIEDFGSNIARFSLIQCSSDMRANYYDLLNYQIERE
jgi:hypothetical protein